MSRRALMRKRKQLWLAAGLMLSAAMSGHAAGAGQPWTLERALKTALTNNPDIHLARTRVAAAEAGLEQANAAFWPRLQLQAGYTRTDNPMMVFGSILNQRAYSQTLDFNHVPDVDDLNTRGLLTMPLYTGGRSTAEREAARSSRQAAREEAVAARHDLELQVARVFHTAEKARAFIRVARAAIAAQETNLVVARQRLDAGTLLKTDVLDLRVRLAEAREELARAESADTLARRTLRNLLGLEQGELAIAESSPELLTPDSLDVSGRAELAAARMRERAAEERVRGAKAGYLPRVSAFGAIDYDYGWKFDRDGMSYTAGGLIQWEAWDGNLTRARAREARANLEMAREETRKLRLAIDLELEQARLDLRTAGERIAAAGEAVASATESAELTRERFEQGAALTTQLMDAESALVAARARLAQAQADRRIALAALRKALGLSQLNSAPE